MDANGFELLHGRKADDLNRTGFTAIELLVVLACVCILAVTLLPALAATRLNSRAFVCLANQRQLMTAWGMYARDNQDDLVVNHGSDGKSDLTPDWAVGWEDYSGSEADTNTALLINPQYALLGPYLQSPALFKCPTDKSCAEGLSGPPRVRSYSMNIAVGPDGGGPGSTSDPHEKPGGGGTPDSWLPYPKYRVFLKESDLIAPTPSQLWVLTDEEPDSINDGCFAVQMALTPATTVWIDVPSKAHSGGCDFAFADGHSEIHKWVEPDEILAPTYTEILNGRAYAHAYNPDILWVDKHTTSRSDGTPLPY